MKIEGWRHGKVSLALCLLTLGACDSLIQEPDISFCPLGIMCPPKKKCALRQNVCISDNCGNGVLDPGEVCDDGNIIDGDGCSHDCKSNETCGNGIVDTAAGEVCDDGNTVSGDGCSADCRSLEGCGNGKVDPGEDCDGGPSGTSNVAKETPVCNSDCTWAKHGDGKVNKAAGEACDGDNNGHGDGRDCESSTCNSDCTVSAHGDGKVNPSAGEQCDGDNLGHGNGTTCESKTCNYNCTPLRCGDGILNVTAGEACDRDGAVGHDGASGANGQSATCNADCTASRCGDGVVNSMAGETCDDGAANSATGNCLPSVCHLNVCGDGFVNQALDQYGHAKEDCDEGASNSDTGACLTSCKKAACGDGFVQAGVEDCDDGPSSATTKGACPYGERTCTLCSACKSLQLTGPFCGDGHQDAGEACDDGANNGATSCPYGTKTCQICNASCTQKVARTGPYCGDGHADPNETCDDGAKNGSTTCDYGLKTCLICAADCSKEVARTGPYCGDGTTSGSNGSEACDDGPKNGATSCDYGTKTCQVCSADCSQTVARTGPYCGDGTKNGSEACDDGNNVTETGCAYGQETCTGCTTDCTAVLNLKGPFCGDGTKNGTEQCDDPRSFTCGTCGQPSSKDKACQTLTRTAATGTITVESPALVGVTLVLDDGLNPPVTFEFVNGGSPQSGNVPIDVSANPTNLAAIAGDIAGAVSSNFSALTPAASQQKVSLTNVNAGAYGNQAIALKPTSTTALVVTGMSGGAGCPNGQPCGSSDDCLSKYCTTSPTTPFGFCQTP